MLSRHYILVFVRVRRSGLEALVFNDGTERPITYTPDHVQGFDPAMTSTVLSSHIGFDLKLKHTVVQDKIIVVKYDIHKKYLDDIVRVGSRTHTTYWIEITDPFYVHHVMVDPRQVLAAFSGPGYIQKAMQVLGSLIKGAAVTPKKRNPPKNEKPAANIKKARRKKMAKQQVPEPLLPNVPYLS